MQHGWGNRVVTAMAAAACGLLPASGAAWADDPSVAAEIEVLKSRLARLERQLAESESRGISSIGEKAGLPTLNLPSGLQGLQISGYADIAYGFSFNEPSGAAANTARIFDTESHGFTPHAFELVLEKPMDDNLPIGFRTDLFFGDDAPVIGSTGLGTTDDEFDIEQLYINFKTPWSSDLEFKVGKFVTLLGAEVIESPANWNYSRSYLFGFAIPFTHTGLLASHPLGEWGSTTFGVVNGWDIVDDANKAKSLLGNITLNPMEDLTLSFNGITGAERTSDNKNNRTVFDFVGTWQATDQLTFMANYDFGHESSIAPVVGTAGGGAGFDTGEWTGLALYAKYDVTPKWSLASRLEWFDDKDAVRTGLGGPGSSTLDDIDFYEWTLTSQWNLFEHVIARLEYRHDKADELVFARDKGFTDYQDTIAAELIYHF